MSTLEEILFYQPLLSCDESDSMSCDENNKWVLDMPTLQHSKIEIETPGMKGIHTLNDDERIYEESVDH